MEIQIIKNILSSIRGKTNYLKGLFMACEDKEERAKLYGQISALSGIEYAIEVELRHAVSEILKEN